MKARVIEKDSDKKRKLLKRRREPSSTDETNSEELQFPELNDRASDAKKKPLMPVLIYMVGQTKIRPKYWMVFG